MKKDLGLVEPTETALEPGDDPKLEKKADAVVAELLNFKGDKEEAKLRSKTTVDTLGSELQRKSALQSDKLKEPIKNLSTRAEEGGGVAKSLLDLREEVEALDPARFSLDAGWKTRLMGYIPGLGSPLKRYFSRYESAQTVIDAIIKSLEIGREQLKRDNITLGDDQKRMTEYAEKLLQAVRFAQLLDKRLQAKVDSLPETDETRSFISEELLFPLRQRIMDLQQQLAVNQQGVLAMEILIRNNNELVRGVNRALNVTVSALQVGVTVALALAQQQQVLDKVQALSKTTSDLIASTAARLKTQGVEIHKQASQTQLNMDSLKKAFADIHDALEDVAQFRTKALPQMADTIKELDTMTDSAGKTVKKMEKGTKMAPVIPLDLD
ncbi:MAG: toxic anion resistance protein [Elusimicrobia bacterium]|nr:toxic anion resistance protein [Elusimicrobiota bacterium]